MNVCIRFSGATIESAERADDVADVCVINVAVDYVCDDIRRVVPHADLVRGEADAYEIPGVEELRTVFGGESFAGNCLIEDRLDIGVHSFIILANKADGRRL